MYAQVGAQQSLWLFLWAQILGWGFQVGIGHGYFEGNRKELLSLLTTLSNDDSGRKPALIDSTFQVFVAPFFLVLEVLFFFGYRKDLYTKVQSNIEKRIEEWKRQKKLH